MRNTSIMLAIASVVSGCATTAPREEKDCSVFVYRNKTMYQVLNPELPHLYANDQRVGTLAVGESICLNLAAGKNTLSVKEPVFFIPAVTRSQLVVDVNPASPIYVRYSKDFNGFLGITPGVVTMNNSFALQPASEGQWRARQ